MHTERNIVLPILSVHLAIRPWTVSELGHIVALFQYSRRGIILVI